MSENDRSSGGADGVPPTNKTLLAVAGVLLAIPVVALLWVSSYARETPRLWGFPFFFWYQFLWVFLCAGLTYTAHRLVLAARKPRPGTTGHAAGASPRDGEGDR
ncbi:MAG: uncharacterized protein JWR85_2532 [Marmoricola sp.]|nr:uncharacterized protein [Marmoricola sp.]